MLRRVEVICAACSEDEVSKLWVISQPSGQRVEDIYEWAKTIVTTYEKEIDNGKFE